MTGAAESACGCADGTCGAGPATPPARSRGVIALLEENCTVCMLCAQECPDWCIEISSHTEVEPAEGRGGRPRTRNVLDDFSIDFGLCMYCGICVEVCPFDALFWAPTSDYAATEAAGLVHGREQLRSWLRDVPAPPPLDAAAAAPGEVVAAERAGVVAGERPGSAAPGAGAAGAGGPGPGRTAP